MESMETSATPSAAAERERYEQSLRRLDTFARRLDSQFRIPGTNIRFGLDPILGLVPGLGDLIGLVLSLYMVIEAIRLGAGAGLVTRMLGNLLLEFVIGLVPVLGDAFDLMWKANDRNARLLRNHITRKLEPGKRRRSWLSYLLVGGFCLLALWLLVLLGQQWVPPGTL